MKARNVIIAIKVWIRENPLYAKEIACFAAGVLVGAWVF